ncbi:MAG: hypothetical protein FJ276_07360 [Planctomycetes bacterium]|nr:hypothetical protein [Planctomycetota bacterium]
MPFLAQPQRQIVFVYPFVAQTAKRVLAGVGVAHDHLVNRVKLGLRKVAYLWAVDGHDVGSYWSQPNRVKRTIRFSPFVCPHSFVPIPTFSVSVHQYECSRSSRKAANASITLRVRLIACTLLGGVLERGSGRYPIAGLHESVVGPKGDSAVLDAVRTVWSSLWSDAALLYRRELALDPQRSRMAVLVQEVILADCSGVAFGRDPRNRQADCVLVEVERRGGMLIHGAIIAREMGIPCVNGIARAIELIDRETTVLGDPTGSMAIGKHADSPSLQSERM